MSFPSFSSFAPAESTSVVPENSLLETNNSLKKGKNTKIKSKDRKHKRKRDADADAQHETPDPLLIWAGAGDLDSSQWDYDSSQIAKTASHWVTDTKDKRIIGLAGDWRLSNSDKQSVDVSPARLEAGPGVESTRFMTALQAPRYRLLPKSSTLSLFDQDFVTVRRRRKHLPIEETHSRYAGLDTVDEHSSEDDLYQSSNESDLEEVAFSAEQLAIKRLETQLSSSPTASHLWLSLLQQSINLIPLSSINARTSRAEVAVAVLRRALKAHPSNHANLILWVRYLSWGEHIWPASDLADLWDTALKSVENEAIWLAWLEWQLRAEPDKGLDAFLKAASQCLATLQDEGVKLMALWRVVVVLQDAGFSERATAIMQAQCELSLFSPGYANALSHAEQLDVLEEFWESETPRVGEDGAQGWASWTKQPKNQRSETHKLAGNASQMVANDRGDPYVAWVMAEHISERRRPVRSWDDTAENDPYSLVMFDDIRPYLVRFYERTRKTELKRVWLSVLGLHLPGFSEHVMKNCFVPSENIKEYWSMTQGLRHAMFNRLYSRKEDSSPSNVPDYESLAGDGFGPVKEWSFQIRDPLDFVDRKFRMWENLDLEGVDVPLVRLIFAQLKDETDSEWDHLAVAFEAAIEIKSAVKFSRHLLSSNRHSLAHWHCHAQLEVFRANPDEARRIYEAALSLPQSSAASAKSGKLWWALAELEWLSGRHESCIAVMGRALGVSVAASSRLELLRIKKGLDDRAATVDAAGLDWLCMRALLELLETRRAASALEIFKTFSRHLTLKSQTLQETVCCRSLIMLYNHVYILQNPTKRSFVRAHILEATELFPNNTLILAFFLHVEKGEGLWGRVRDTLGSGTVFQRNEHETVEPVSKTMGRKLWEIWAAGQWLSIGRLNAKNHLRKLFGEDINDPLLRKSAIFWRLYVEMEIRMGDLKTAKHLLKIAILQCPFHKELYLLAFGALRVVFLPSELQGWMDVMVERGLRLRQDLEHHLQGWTEVESTADNVPIERDDVEMKADEYRMLAPF